MKTASSQLRSAKRENDVFKIGCDPEFVLTNGGFFIEAFKVFNENSDFGIDGAISIGELRPQPANNAFTLVANLRLLFIEGINRIPLLRKDNIHFLAGHFKFKRPLGGHIHISSSLIPRYELNRLYYQLESVLSTLSEIIDDLEERDNRIKAGFGTGWKLAEHGGIEYRSPGSWLLSPKVAFVNLFLAEVVTIEFIKENVKAFFEFQETKEDKSCMDLAIIKFVENSSIDNKVKKTGIKVIESVFKLTPLNWSKDFKEEWL